jgi:hypothetical protein
MQLHEETADRIRVFGRLFLCLCVLVSVFGCQCLVLAHGHTRGPAEQGLHSHV